MGYKGKGGRGKRAGGEDLSSARGLGCVMGTCEVAREREGSRELVTLLLQALEQLRGEGKFGDVVAAVEEQKRDDTQGNTKGEGEVKEEEDRNDKDETHDKETKELSAEELLRMEVEGVKAKESSFSQEVVSLKTGVKGVVFAKIRKGRVCPVALVEAMFRRVKESGLPICRYLHRVVPLQKVFFPNIDELTKNTRLLVGLPPLAAEKEPDSDSHDTEESEERSSKRMKVEDTSTKVEKNDHIDKTSSDDKYDEIAVETKKDNVKPPLSYNFSLKIRNHDTLKKSDIVHCVTSTLPGHRYYYNYKDFKGIFVVNIFKNIAGISLIEDESSMPDFNIAKYQEKHGSGGS